MEDVRKEIRSCSTHCCRKRKRGHKHVFALLAEARLFSILAKLRTRADVAHGLRSDFRPEGFPHGYNSIVSGSGADTEKLGLCVTAPTAQSKPRDFENRKPKSPGQRQDSPPTPSSSIFCNPSSLQTCAVRNIASIKPDQRRGAATYPNLTSFVSKQERGWELESRE